MSSMESSLRRKLALWLLACCLMVLATLVVGGVTRLTHSGLSIVEWEPLVGTVPPLSEQDWLQVFHEYQQTPEYQKVNAGMSLPEFQRIFWWEYWHRLLARAIGLVFFLPMAWFWLRRALPGWLKLRLVGMLLLGGLQGALGWYMVRSGLVDNPRVSHYRLAAHLGLAFLLFGWMLWTALDVSRPVEGRPWSPRRRSLQRFGTLLVALVFVMALSGALVAGLRAGLVHNTFPLMDGGLVPPGALMLSPWWRNFLENPATVQLDHRLLAWLLAVLVPVFRWRARGSIGLLRVSLDAMAALFALQVGLGIATLLWAVPLSLAAAHQAVALLFFGSVVWVRHELQAAPPD